MRLSSCEVCENGSGWESYFAEGNTWNFARFFHVLSSYVDNITIHEVVQKKVLQCDSNFHENRLSTSRFSWKSAQYEPSLDVVNEFLHPLPTFISDLRQTRCKGWKLAHGRRQVTTTLSIVATAQRTAPRILLLLPYVACLFFVFSLDHLNIHPVLTDSKQGTCSPDVNKQLLSQLRLVFSRASLVPINSQPFPRFVRLALHTKRTCLSGLLSVLTEQACWCIF